MNTLTFPFADAPKTDGELIDVAPGIKWLCMPLPLALNHINLYLIRDHDGWMIVDTGLATERTCELWQKIITEKLAGERITGVICTHFHFDHAGLAGWLTEWLRVPLYMSYGEYYTLRVVAAEKGDEVPWGHQEFFRHAGFPAEALAEVMIATARFISPSAPRRTPDDRRARMAPACWRRSRTGTHVAPLSAGQSADRR